MPSKNSGFQSTHPHGCEPDCQHDLQLVWGVSIHAPARVRTAIDAAGRLPTHVSIHAPARVRTSASRNVISLPLFQSTHPHGCEQPDLANPTLQTKFQSTHPHG